MNTLTKCSPFRTTRRDPIQQQLADFERGLNRFFGRSPQPPGNGDEPISAAAPELLADITEDDKEYLVKAELPEVKKDDVKVTVEEGVLRISGERKFEKEEKNKKYHRVERNHGSFLRTFTQPDVADGAKVSAYYKDAMLKVRLPKTAEAKPKAIDLKVA